MTRDASNNKSLVEEYIHCLSTRQFDKLADFWDLDTGNWWVNGTPPAVPYGGDLGARERLSQLLDVLGGFEQYEFRIKTLTAEGPRVVVEGQPKGDGPQGRRYRNDVIMSITLQGGKIVDKREYLDHEAVKQSLE